MPHINTNKMTNKGSKIPLFPKWSNILMLKMCFSGCSFCALLWHSILFPKDAKYWMPRIILFNKCVCNFYHIQAASSVFVDMKDHQMVQSAVRSGRTDVRFYPLHGRKWSLTDWQGEFLPIQWLGSRKSSLLHLMIAQTPPVLSHCQLLIQESTWESPAVPSIVPIEVIFIQLKDFTQGFLKASPRR